MRRRRKSEAGVGAEIGLWVWLVSALCSVVKATAESKREVRDGKEQNSTVARHWSPTIAALRGCRVRE